jgi:murein DD-endopeptidase MepM/ murein hydrolase activator NlpD
MPETDERSGVARLPVPRPPLDDAPPAAPTASAEPDAAAAAAEPRRRRLPARPSLQALRRLPQPPGRRAPLWLAALIAGALLAAAPGVVGETGPRTIDASDYGLGIADAGLTGELGDAGVRRGITEAEARLRLDELAASRAAREPKIVSPVTDFRLTTCYCPRWGQMHYGLDMAAPLGTPIYSAIDGVVLEAGPASGFGNAVYIQDEDGNVHIYGHMRYYAVEAGQIVHAGDEIATIGNEGYSTGPHLHWEIHQGGRDGAPTDPQAWLAERDVFI